MARETPSTQGRPGGMDGGMDPNSEAGADRFEAMLEERFSTESRKSFATELAEYDKSHPPAPITSDQFKDNLRFKAPVPGPVKKALATWLPGIMAHAHAQGLSLRAPQYTVQVHTRQTFEAEHGPIPEKVPLPASSYRYDAFNKQYAINVVAPPNPQSMEELLTILRAVLTRLYGDVFLREDVLTGEPYREDLEADGAKKPAAGDPTTTGTTLAGAAEQIHLLSETGFSTPALEQAVAAFARGIGVDMQRKPDQAYKAYYQDLAKKQATEEITRDQEAMLGDAFAGYAIKLKEDLPAQVEKAVAACDDLNRQLSLLPPEEKPEYEKLKARNPLHFLRAVHLRLEFLLEAMGALIEDFDTLDGSSIMPPSLVEERLGGQMTHLEKTRLARPYLVPEVTLGDTLLRQQQGFPLEVHGYLQNFPPLAPGEKGEKRFKALSKKLEGHLHQRLYNAMVVLKHWLRLREASRDESFPATPKYQALKGAAANFRFRLPLLQALLARVGVIIDLVEEEGAAMSTRNAVGTGSTGGTGDSAGRQRFPVAQVSRAWGQFVAHALVAGYFDNTTRDQKTRDGAAPGQGGIKGFQARIYLQGVGARLKKQALQAGGKGGSGQLMYLLHQVYVHGGADALPMLVETLKEAPASFRFTVSQAINPAAKATTPEERLAQLDAWAHALVRERAERRKHRITLENLDG